MFEARMENVSNFRKLIEAVKELVKSVNLDVNQKGISVQAMDSCHIALVSMQLREKAFSTFFCQRPFTIGLTIDNVVKILKLAGADDVLTLSCEDDPISLKFRFESKKGEKMAEFSLALIHIESENMGIPDTQFTSSITMPSSEFGRICREFVLLSETIQIQTKQTHVKFSMNSEMGSGCTIFKDQDTGNQADSILLDIQMPVCQSFASRYLNLFSKGGNISHQVVINMSNETPLMILYKIFDGLGQIKYFLAPKITQDDE